MGTVVLLDLMGGVALLLWGLHMVQSGILRAFGSELRRLLSKALGNRFAAFAAGLGLTAVLQSSKATGLMTASFAAEGLVALVLFIVGVLTFRTSANTRVRNLGRAAIGLGLMLLALHILLTALGPAE